MMRVSTISPHYDKNTFYEVMCLNQLSNSFTPIDLSTKKWFYYKKEPFSTHPQPMVYVFWLLLFFLFQRKKILSKGQNAYHTALTFALKLTYSVQTMACNECKKMQNVCGLEDNLVILGQGWANCSSQ